MDVTEIQELNEYPNAHTFRQTCQQQKFPFQKPITGSLYIPYTPPSNIASSLIPHLYRCNVDVLFLSDQVITFNELKYLGSSAVTCTLYNTVVKNFDGSDTSFFSILQQFTNLKHLSLHGQNFYSSIKKGDMKNVLKLSSKLETLKLFKITESFDIESFHECLKNFKNRTSIVLDFTEGDISEAYGNRINVVADDILATTSFSYSPPILVCSSIAFEKQLALRELSENLQINL